MLQSWTTRVSTLRRHTVLCCLLVSACAGGAARVAAQGVTNSLFGDFKVDQSKVAGLKPISFDILLYGSTGRIVSRQTVASNGRYRFTDLPNGDYVLVAQMQNSEVTRITVRLASAVSTDVRQDIALEWRPDAAKKAAKPDVVAASAHYERGAEQQKQFDRALAANGQKKYAEAAALLRQLVAADARDFESWTELGTAHFHLQQYAEAEQAYQQALTLKPDFSLALVNLGKLRFTRKDYPGAIAVLTRAVALKPPSADANYFLGEAYLDQALADIKRGSQDIPALNEEARQAVNYLNAALQLDPIGKAEVHLRLADIYNVLGMKAEAVAECKKFLAKKPDYPERKKIEQFIAANKKQ